MGIPVRTIPQMKVKYKDVFHLKNMYVMMHEYLIEEGFVDESGTHAQAGHNYIEKLYMEKFCQAGLHAGGKEMWIWWRTIKKPETKYQGYYQYHLDVDFHVVYAQPPEKKAKDAQVLISQGKKIPNLIFGEVEMFFKGWIEADYNDQWETHPWLKHFHKLYYTRVLSHEFDKREKELWRDVFKLTSKVKRFLNMRTFIPVPEPFWRPIYGYEA
jgi:hypothetical protein